MVDWHQPESALIADGIARFVPPAAVRGDAAFPPSLALVTNPAPSASVPATFHHRPRFAHRDGKWVAHVPVQSGANRYGTGEIAGPLLRDGARTVCWNTDSFKYDDTNVSLYQSHPWVIVVNPDGTAAGMLADTTFRCTIDLRHDIEFAAEGLPFGVYIIERNTPQDVVAALAELTGKMPLPPKWALGYHQSRWSYEPASRVLRLADEFRHRHMPCDCIWLDIDYMDGFRCFTFDREKFPDPARLCDDLRARGFHSVWMIDCGIKADEHDPVYASGRAGDHFVKTADGREFHGKVWPGPCAFPDFTREATRRWWAELYKDFLAKGPDGVWNDMNEPAVFDDDTKQVPETLHHRADEALGGPGAHARYHNVYGMLMVRASREGIQAARPEKRPFVLTRANFVGGHRYAATWTGDNVANWDHLRWSIPMVLNMGLSGQPFVGPDIGGFFGNADAQLFARWMGIGALLPFARGHSIKDSHDHEPWALGEACERTCRLALLRRYRLLPYLYTLFREASVTGLPVARPLFFADPRDPALRAADDAFLSGDSILVRARVGPDRPCLAPMPAGTWRRVELVGESWTQTDLDSELPELWIRAGSIVPIGPAIEFVGQKPLDPLTLLVCPDAPGRALGRLYEDAGEGYEHERGQFRQTTYQSLRDGDRLTVHTEQSLGGMPTPDRGVEVVVMADGPARTGAGRDGEPIRVALLPGDP